MITDLNSVLPPTERFKTGENRHATRPLTPPGFDANAAKEALMTGIENAKKPWGQKTIQDQPFSGANRART